MLRGHLTTKPPKPVLESQKTRPTSKALSPGRKLENKKVAAALPDLPIHIDDLLADGLAGLQAIRHVQQSCRGAEALGPVMPWRQTPFFMVS